MASNTKQTKAQRRRKRAKQGRAKKRGRAQAGTPKFPVHPEK